MPGLVMTSVVEQPMDHTEAYDAARVYPAVACWPAVWVICVIGGLSWVGFPATVRRSAVTAPCRTGRRQLNSFLPCQHLPMTLVPVPERGRTFTASRLTRLGDVSPGGRLRFDAIARYLQDVANDDAVDAALEGAMAWV